MYVIIKSEYFYSFTINSQSKLKKSQTCEGVAHLRISVWHLLIKQLFTEKTTEVG